MMIERNINPPYMIVVWRMGTRNRDRGMPGYLSIGYGKCYVKPAFATDPGLHWTSAKKPLKLAVPSLQSPVKGGGE
jgi:hypothetical protein